MTFAYDPDGIGIGISIGDIELAALIDTCAAYTPVPEGGGPDEHRDTHGANGGSGEKKQTVISAERRGRRKKSGSIHSVKKGAEQT